MRVTRGAACGAAMLVSAACAPERPAIAERSTEPSAVAACTPDPWSDPDVREIATDLTTPWAIVVSGDSVAYLTERAGRVSLLDLRSGSAPRTLATLPVIEVGENGLLGASRLPDGSPGVLVAGVFSPSGGQRSLFTRLLRRTQRTLGLRVGTDFVFRLHHVRPDGSTRLVADGIPAATLHGGGAVMVHDDSTVLLAVGDSRDPWTSQDGLDLRGKLLRVRVTATGVATPGDGITVAAIGVRNSQGLARLPDGQVLFLDHGPSGAGDEAGRVGRDELNVWREQANYGWPIEAGIHDNAAFVSPIHEWTAPAAPAGLLALPSPLPGDDAGSADSASATAFVTALRAQALFRLELARRDGQWRVQCADTLGIGALGRLRALAAHPAGGLLLATSNRDSRGVPRPGDDRILWIRPRTDR